MRDNSPVYAGMMAVLQGQPYYKASWVWQSRDTQKLYCTKNGNPSIWNDFINAELILIICFLSLLSYGNLIFIIITNIFEPNHSIYFLLLRKYLRDHAMKFILLFVRMMMKRDT